VRLRSGAKVGPYEITGTVGAGGMGEVYRARDHRLGRDVAVKVLPSDVAQDRDRLARFEREARLSSALNHPNIVTIHDFERSDDHCYLVMELVRGESLRELLRRGPLPLRQLLDVASGVANGLAAAHAAGIVHRDLKPENVMVTAERSAKILDFGLVKPVADDSADAVTEEALTGTGAIVGTSAYMSPEQIRGQELGPASDQFSFGLVLFEMLTGRHPFRRDSALDTVNSILRDEPPPLDDTVPEQLAWIVERCLSKDPAQRYGSTADLAHDLEMLRRRGRPAAVSTARTEKRTVSLTPWIVSGIALLLLLGAAAALLKRPGTAAGFTAPLHVHLATGEVTPEFEETAVTVQISPDGHRLVTQGFRQTGGTELWLTDLRTGESRLFASNAYGPAWSENSQSIAFFAEGKLKTQRVDGGPAKVICDAVPEGMPAWHGEKILFFRFSGPPQVSGMYEVSSAGGTPKLLSHVRRQGALAWWPSFLPDGKRFLFTQFRNTQGIIEHDLVLASIDGGTPKKLGAIDSRALFVSGNILYVRDGTLVAHPFDLEREEWSGEPRPLVHDVNYFRSTGLASFSVSGNGLLAWRSARGTQRLAWLDRSGAEVSTIETAHFAGSGRISRDGKRYVVTVLDAKQGVGDVWIYDLARGSSTRLTTELLDQQAPLWAYDDSTIYYRTDGNRGPPDIFELSPGQRPTPLHVGRSVEQPEDVSPVGKWLAFVSYLAASSDIFLLPLGEKDEPRPIETTQFHEISPRFSPDGKWLAFASNLSGRYEIYVRAVADGGSPMRVSQHGGTMPRWGRDGKELFFLGPEGQLYSAPTGGGFGVPRMLFQVVGMTTFEPALDSQRFLAHIEKRSGEPEVQLLLNWTALTEPGS
jgi:Tol biopolymer transport system component